MLLPTTVEVELEPDVYIYAAEKIDARHCCCARVAVYKSYQELADSNSWVFLESSHVVFFSDMLKPEWARTGDIWYNNEADRIVALLLVSQLAREHNANVRRKARLVAKQALVPMPQAPLSLSSLIDCHSPMITISASASTNDTHHK